MKLISSSHLLEPSTRKVGLQNPADFYETRLGQGDGTEPESETLMGFVLKHASFIVIVVDDDDDDDDVHDDDGSSDSNDTAS